MEENKMKKISLGMFLVTIGIVYGDIGTSPMYVMKSIVEGNGGLNHVDTDFIIGSLSLVIWTITLLTTIKHVLIALRADNHGEGGIFALYSLVKGCGKWLIIPTMIGGCTMLADGVLTPAVTVTTAVEGLRSIELMDRMLGEGQFLVLVITISIVSALFLIQRSGTSQIGKLFGPVMLIWFLFLGITGLLFSLFLCYPCAVQPGQQGRSDDSRKRISVYDRSRGPVYRYGPRRKGKHPYQLAVRQSVSDSELYGTVHLDHKQSGQRRTCCYP